MAGKKKEAELTVQVEVVPVSGAVTNKIVKLQKSGASVAEVLETAGVSAKNKDLLVNGKPATLATHVTAKDSVQAKDSVSVQAKEVKVQVSERPAGS